MKQVWKCDFCSRTQDNVEGLEEHETGCSFNPINKKCFTCAHSWDSGHDYSIPECYKNLSTVTGRDDGNCAGWKSDELVKQLRFTTSEPGVMGVSSDPLKIPEGELKVIRSEVKGEGAYIHGDAEGLAGYDIPIFLDGDMAQLDLPVDEQDILMVLPDGDFPCIAKLEYVSMGKHVPTHYLLTLKK